MIDLHVQIDESFTIEDFYEIFMTELAVLQYTIDPNNNKLFDKYFGDTYNTSVDQVKKELSSMGQTVSERLNSNGIGTNFRCGSLLFWLRMIISLFIQQNKKDFEHLIVKTTKKAFHEFIKTDVEQLNEPVGSIQIHALSAALQIPFRYV